MHRRTITILLVAAPLALLGAGQLQPQREAKPAAQGAPPTVQWAGHDTKHQPGWFLIRDEEAWKQLWAAHTGYQGAQHGALARNFAPLIDFNRALVIAYFPGPNTNCDGHIASDIQPFPDRTLIRFEASTYQSSSPPGQEPPKHNPYGIWVIPATTNPITIEEGRRGLKDNPITYREVHRFPAPGR